MAISIDGGETGVITFSGVGYDKRLMGDAMNIGDASHLTGVPSVQRHLTPGQVKQSVLHYRCHTWLTEVTSLRRCAHANAPAASY